MGALFWSTPWAGASPSASAEYFGRVSDVLAGDRLLINCGGRHTLVRVYGVTCVKGRWGLQAQHFTRELALSRGVHVQIRGRDPRGTRQAQINFIGGRSLGEELIRNGLARWERDSAPHEKRLALLEAEARAARRGLWST